MHKVDGKPIVKIGDFGLSKAFDIAGMAGEPLPEARIIKLHPGDQPLLCSDGFCPLFPNG